MWPFLILYTLHRELDHCCIWLHKGVTDLQLYRSRCNKCKSSEMSYYTGERARIRLLPSLKFTVFLVLFNPRPVEVDGCGSIKSVVCTVEDAGSCATLDDTGEFGSLSLSCTQSGTTTSAGTEEEAFPTPSELCENTEWLPLVLLSCWDLGLGVVCTSKPASPLLSLSSCASGV